jgi:SAM-dependent methyltransferase
VLNEEAGVNRTHIEFLSSPRWAEMLQADLLPWVVSVGALGDDVLEIGPGPGLTTDLLRDRVDHVTAVEIDPVLAGELAERLAGTNVTIIEGDAADAGLEGDRFSAVTCFSVLHHVPNARDQDRLFFEIGRVLRPGGIFVGVDSRDLETIRNGHVNDTFNPLPPDTLPHRLEAGGMEDVQISEDDYQIRFVARKPRAGAEL